MCTVTERNTNVHPVMIKKWLGRKNSAAPLQNGLCENKIQGGGQEIAVIVGNLSNKYSGQFVLPHPGHPSPLGISTKL